MDKHRIASAAHAGAYAAIEKKKERHRAQDKAWRPKISEWAAHQHHPRFSITQSSEDDAETAKVLGPIEAPDRRLVNISDDVKYLPNLLLTRSVKLDKGIQQHAVPLLEANKRYFLHLLPILDANQLPCSVPTAYKREGIRKSIALHLTHACC